MPVSTGTEQCCRGFLRKSIIRLRIEMSIAWDRKISQFRYEEVYRGPLATLQQTPTPTQLPCSLIHCVHSTCKAKRSHHERCISAIAAGSLHLRSTHHGTASSPCHVSFASTQSRPNAKQAEGRMATERVTSLIPCRCRVHPSTIFSCIRLKRFTVHLADLRSLSVNLFA